MPLTSAEKEVLKDFGRELQKFREDRGLSQEEFAEKISLSPRQLQNVETGRKKTSLCFWLRFLGLMKPETQKSFTQRFIPKAQRTFGVKPLRRADTSV